MRRSTPFIQSVASRPPDSCREKSTSESSHNAQLKRHAPQLLIIPSWPRSPSRAGEPTQPAARQLIPSTPCKDFPHPQLLLCTIWSSTYTRNGGRCPECSPKKCAKNAPSRFAGGQNRETETTILARETAGSATIRATAAMLAPPTGAPRASTRAVRLVGPRACACSPGCEGASGRARGMTDKPWASKPPREDSSTR